MKISIGDTWRTKMLSTHTLTLQLLVLIFFFWLHSSVQGRSHQLQTWRLLKTNFCETGVNIAFRKPANQSTTVRGGSALNANDGELSSDHETKKCSETQKEASPWWQVDLLRAYAVKVVRVTTRGCCGHQPLQDLEIRVGNSSTDLQRNPLCAWFPGTIGELFLTKNSKETNSNLNGAFRWRVNKNFYLCQATDWSVCFSAIGWSGRVFVFVWSWSVYTRW